MVSNGGVYDSSNAPEAVGCRSTNTCHCGSLPNPLIAHDAVIVVPSIASRQPVIVAWSPNSTICSGKVRAAAGPLAAGSGSSTILNTPGCGHHSLAHGSKV